MAVEIVNRTKSQINSKLVQRVCEIFLREHSFGGRVISIAFIGDRVIRKINQKYRDIDQTTDILAFPVGAGQKEFKEDDFGGELLINYAQIKRQARHYSKSVDEELVFILVHGLLHLLGHEDKTKKGKQEMEKLGKEFMAGLKI